MNSSQAYSSRYIGHDDSSTFGQLQINSQSQVVNEYQIILHTGDHITVRKTDLPENNVLALLVWANKEGKNTTLSFDDDRIILTSAVAYMEHVGTYDLRGNQLDKPNRQNK